MYFVGIIDWLNNFRELSSHCSVPDVVPGINPRQTHIDAGGLHGSTMHGLKICCIDTTQLKMRTR